MAGGALATKYTGLQLMMLLVLLVLAEHLRADRNAEPAQARVASAAPPCYWLRPSY